MKRSQLIGLLAVIAFGGVAAYQLAPKPKPSVTTESIKRSVTALGRLTPRGGNVKLSVPAGISGGNEIVTEWLVPEGATITRGQVLARLSSYEQLNAAVESARETLRLSKSLLPFLVTSEEKARQLLERGSLSKEEAAQSKSTLISKRSEILSNETALRKAQSELNSSIVKSPLNGRLIKIYSWPGMKETSDGLALAAETSNMQVWAQVFQTDIQRVKPGQAATVTAESGGFNGTLKATVESIVGEVSERDLFAISGNNDVNARVILVKLNLDPQEQQLVEQLSGLNVTVKFNTLN